MLGLQLCNGCMSNVYIKQGYLKALVDEGLGPAPFYRSFFNKNLYFVLGGFSGVYLGPWLFCVLK